MADALMTAAPRAQTPPRTDEVVLRTRNLSKQYGQRLAVNNLNLEVHRGEIFGFLGPNGAGKTTTIRMALNLIAPTGGTVEVLGQDIAAHGARILPRVGALVEQPALYLYMTGLDNLKAVASVLGGVPTERMEVLDEPANGLDPAGIVEMRDLMRRLAAEGKTVFISSHVLTEVQQICTRVAIINNGRLVTESTVEELTSGHGEFEVTVERAAEALALIQRQPWGVGARIEDGTLITPAPNARGRDLNTFLVSAGFAPDALGIHTLDLENVFLKLTGNGHVGVQ